MAKYIHIGFKSFPELIEGLRFHMENHTNEKNEYIVADNSAEPPVAGFFCTKCYTWFYVLIKNLTPVDKKIIGPYENQSKLPQKIRSSEFFGF
jgi:hypothetical protein